MSSPKSDGFMSLKSKKKMTRQISWIPSSTCVCYSVIEAFVVNLKINCSCGESIVDGCFGVGEKAKVAPMTIAAAAIRVAKESNMRALINFDIINAIS